ncbi:MAG: Crp/Fnr family transcriptional regulator [Alphaproteobacteria bacterium]|nr:Crp/Fnr family transcriptional regulator [Alphaproteobacteria bacterium]
MADPTRMEQARSPNRLLARLSEEDFEILSAHLEPVDLPVRRPLETRNRKIDYVYFIESGVASIVATNATDSIEVGIVGYEGMSGFALLLEAGRARHDVFMQVAGGGQRLEASTFVACLEASRSLHRALLPFVHELFMQVASTCVANGRNTIEERLARWLLMVCDRARSDHVKLTHEFLSAMLGVRRPGVTVTLDRLRGHGLLRLERGDIHILDREGLERIAGVAYRTVAMIDGADLHGAEPGWQHGPESKLQLRAL